ncbi:MAG: hypothetical protein DCF17_04465 [Shackletoniella antarctica]|uniref:Uncharacterized protein n=1 Tax=Shackletoniella antarctica TaxID=268115 RepID=A0A2W4WIN5_9CYAN|nr:MAG: hypothetical protein DCF17_04465 [Shackletoniella antarctica]
MPSQFLRLDLAADGGEFGWGCGPNSARFAPSGDRLFFVFGGAIASGLANCNCRWSDPNRARADA